MTYKPYYWLNADSRTVLKRGYIADGVEPEDHYRKIAENAELILDIDGFADKMTDYISRGWYSLSSPVISNFGAEKGLPISCNGSFVSDTMEAILGKMAEIGMMTKEGAG